MSKQLSPMKKTMKKCFIAVAPKTYVRQKYYRAFGKKLNETDPQTLSEKIHCFMMYNRNPIYIQCADKLEVRKYIENKLGGGMRQISYQSIMLS